MAEILNLSEAVARFVHDGDIVAMEGFTHLIPFAAGHEVIRQKRRDLTLIRMTPDILYDQLIGMGAARKLIFSWGGNPGVGSLHRLRDAIERGWPGRSKSKSTATPAWPTRSKPAPSGMPCAIFRGYLGSDLARVNPNIKFRDMPVHRRTTRRGRRRSPRRQHHSRSEADREGNVLVEGIVGVQKEAVLAARRAIATVEEIVDDLDTRSPNAIVLAELDAVGGRPRFRAAHILLTRTATTAATTRSTSSGIRSRAIAKHFSRG